MGVRLLGDDANAAAARRAQYGVEAFSGLSQGNTAHQASALGSDFREFATPDPTSFCRPLSP